MYAKQVGRRSVNMWFNRFEKHEGGNSCFWHHLHRLVKRNRFGKWIRIDSRWRQQGGSRNRKNRILQAIAIILFCFIGFKANAETYLRFQLTGPITFAEVDYLQKSLTRLEPIIPFVPTSEARGRIILEGYFKESPNSLWSAIQSISNDRFEVSEHIEMDRLIITGKRKPPDKDR